MIHRDDQRLRAESQKCCDIFDVSWQQLSVGNGRKMNQGQPHPRVFLKCKNSFLCVKCMACSKSILVDTWQL
jgi:hypothetical protein